MSVPTVNVKYTGNFAGNGLSVPPSNSLLFGNSNFSCSGTNSSILNTIPPQMAYTGQGPLMANTYTFSTAGPLYKVSMGTTPMNLAANASPLVNNASYFTPCGAYNQNILNSNCF